ncbi:MAG: hypothetical protein K2H41_10055 [Acetatifactor sp.]|nr:hypothetical protein [Acetatifactor sp.]
MSEQCMRTLILTNREGKSLKIRLRPYRKGDEEGMIACIRDEYGDSYFRRGFYDPLYLQKESGEGRTTFLVAETEERDIAGMMILKQFYPDEDMCEIASQIFRKRYRGYGLAMPFFEFGMEILLSRTYSAAFCLSVLFHDVTQRLLYRLGLRATGLVLNVFDTERMSHSYDNGRNKKHSLGIQVRAAEKKDAGILYLPPEHWDFCQKVYDGLGVDYRLTERTGEDFLEKADAMSVQLSQITYKNDVIHSSLEIRIHHIGADLEQRIRELHSRYPLRGRQTAGVFLNCNEPRAVQAYYLLKRYGYFFAGLKPLCSEREYLVMHHPGEVEIYFEDYCVSEEFSRLLGYIKTCYEGRKRENGL